MSTPAPTLEQSRPTGVVRALTDGWVVAKRNLIKIKRVPEVLVFVLISPIMFVLLFAFVFGGAIDTGGCRGVRAYQGLHLLPVAL